MSKVHIEDAFYVRGHTAAQAEQLIERLTWGNPDYETAKRAGTKYKGISPEWNPAIAMADGSLRVPRGCLRTVRSVLDQIEWDSHVVAYDTPTVPLEDLGVQLRPYQQQALATVVARRQGVVVLPCGAGKTTIGAALAVHLNQPTIILVHTRDIQQQWVETLERVGSDSVFQLGGMSRWQARALKPGEVAVCMVQKMNLMGYPEYGPMLDSCGLLMVDECHRAPARMYRPLVDQCAARWRVGLTATPDRSDGWGIALPVLFGPVLVNVPVKKLVSDGYLVKPLIVPVQVDYTPPDRAFSWSVQCPSCHQVRVVKWERLVKGFKCSTRLPEGGTCRHKQDRACEYEQDKVQWSTMQSLFSDSTAYFDSVLALSKGAADEGRTTLTLTPRVAVAKRLAMELQASSIDAAAVVGSMSALAREEAINRMRTGKISNIVATKLADEGLDVPTIDCMVLAQSGRDGGKATQRVGRACRPSGSSQPILFEIVGPGVFRNQWRKRAQTYTLTYGQDCIQSWDPVQMKVAIALLRDRSGTVR